MFKFGNKISFKKLLLYKKYLILISIMILSFILRIYHLGLESVGKNEIFSIDMSKLSFYDIILETAKDTHPPFYYFILKYWMQLFGDNDFSTRFPSIVFGLISIYVIYRFSVLLFGNGIGKNIGIISSFILSINLFHIKYSQEVRFYILIFLLILVSNFYFIKILRNKDIKYSRLGYLISTTILMLTHYYGFIYWFFQNVYYVMNNLINKKDRKDLKNWILLNVVIILILSPWIPFLAFQMKNNLGSDKSNCRICSISEPDTFDIFNIFNSFAGNDKILFIYLLIGITSILYNLNNLKIKNNFDIKKLIQNEQIFLLIWIFLPIITSLIISYTIRPLVVARYFIASLPAFVILASKLIVDFKKLSIILIILFILTVSTLPILLTYYTTPQKEQWKEVVNYIEKTDKKDPVLINDADGLDYDSFRHYDNITKIIKINNGKDLEKYIKKYNNIWLIFSSFAEGSSDSKYMRKELSIGFKKYKIIKFFQVNIYHFYDKNFYNKNFKNQSNSDQTLKIT